MPLLAKSERPAAPRAKRRSYHLDDADPVMRRHAVQDLDGSAGAVADLAPLLAGETDHAVRSAMFTVLAGIATPEALDAILPCLQSEDAELRNAAVEAAQQMPDAVANRIEALLADPDPDQRLFALDILQDLAHPHAPDWIAPLLSRDTDPNVVGTAIDRLAECGRPDMVDAIRAAAARFEDCTYIRFACDFACERLAGPPDQPEGPLDAP
ncbi:HEAT repeat [Rhodovulum sp. P5]|uniref:HEAT repeat domain-containing protein n=1 Tax=Rhodovulum sp. P5 TaxID=1564506 RepID=UPI0009C1BE03|nr:HEAT repeat domain-containing protein [Rhodovulum sp. P5]ARE40330.1 HEAT repeat [Rhodovulum sp. P5]